MHHNKMKYNLYTTSRKAWDAMLKTIKQAKKSIYIEMYIFSNDTFQSHDFISVLKKKANEGVRVIIIADAFGSDALKKDVSNAIEKTKIEFIFFSHWIRHIHRKILIVDEKIAFIGGVNIKKSFIHWNDLQLKLSGRIVKKILKSFAYTYAMSGGKDTKILKIRESIFSGKIKHLFIEHWPIRNIHTLKSHYIEKIGSAQTSIKIVTPYFTPPRWLISLLDNAIRRNVNVEILIPQKSDVPIIDRVSQRYIYELHLLGIKFYLNKSMNHAKLLIIDNKEGLLGSQNIDPLSFEINTEAGIFFQEKKLLNELSVIIEKWKKNSIKFESKQYKMKPIDYVITVVMRLFWPIL